MVNVPDPSSYPFLPDAAREYGDIPIERLFTAPAYNSDRVRARNMVLACLRDEPLKPVDRLPVAYTLARIMIVAMNDQPLKRKFAVWMSKQAAEKLAAESPGELREIGTLLDVPCTDDYTVSLIVYLKHAAGFHDAAWKLVNQRVESGTGNVRLNKDKYARLVEEAVKLRVQAYRAAPDADVYLSDYLEAIGDELAKHAREDLPVTDQAFPPCMAAILTKLQQGINLPHTARFAATAFLLNVGMSAEDIMKAYRAAPDFREDITRYQVEHVTGLEYKCPACKTMQSYGNCEGKDWMCERVAHPLSYYNWKAKRLTKKP